MFAVCSLYESLYSQAGSASYPDVSLSRAKEGGKETDVSVPFPWPLEAHYQSLASTLRKTKRLRRRLRSGSFP